MTRLTHDVGIAVAHVRIARANCPIQHPHRQNRHSVGVQSRSAGCVVRRAFYSSTSSAGMVARKPKWHLAENQHMSSVATAAKSATDLLRTLATNSANGNLS